MKQLVENIKKELSFGLSIPAILWQILFLGIPFLIIVYLGFYSDDGITLRHIASLFTSAHIAILMRTLLVASFVATLSVFIAFPVAYFIALHVASMYKNIFLFFLTLPFWTNFLIQVYSWFFLLEKQGLVNIFLLKIGIISQPLSLMYNMFAIIIVTLYCYLPFILLPLYSAMEKIDLQLFDASMDLGASWWQTVCRIIIPLAWPGIRVGFLLVFVPVFGEFAIPEIIGGAKYLFTGSLITYYFTVMQDNALGSAFTLFSLVGLVLCIICLYFLVYVCNTLLFKKELS